MNIVGELEQVLAALEAAQVDYALCGGFALAAYGIVRATVDIDFLAEETSLPKIEQALTGLGFRRESKPLRFQQEQLIMERFFKPDAESEEFLVVDVLLVGELTRKAWDSRRVLKTNLGLVKVVSPGGLIEMKSLRGSGQDLDDIKRLKELQ